MPGHWLTSGPERGRDRLGGVRCRATGAGTRPLSLGACSVPGCEGDLHCGSLGWSPTALPVQTPTHTEVNTELARCDGGPIVCGIGTTEFTSGGDTDSAGDGRGPCRTPRGATVPDRSRGTASPPKTIRSDARSPSSLSTNPQGLPTLRARAPAPTRLAPSQPRGQRSQRPEPPALRAAHRRGPCRDDADEPQRPALREYVGRDPPRTARSTRRRGLRVYQGLIA